MFVKVLESKKSEEKGTGPFLLPYGELIGMLIRLALFDGGENLCNVAHDRGLRQVNSVAHDYTVITTARH